MGNILEGSSNEIRGQYQPHDRTTRDSSSDFDKEELELATALSISEQDLKGKEVIENELHLNEDEQVARAPQEEYEPLDKANQQNLNVKSPPQSPLNDHKRICPGCNSEIEQSSSGSVWHRECIRCHSCKQPISENEFVMSDNLPYHESCFKEQYYLKCDVCKSFIPTINDDGRKIKCGGHRFWPQKYCLSHNQDGTPRCCSCERMQPVDAKYLILEDGRNLCSECSDSSIMDSLECQQLYCEIQEFYEDLNMKLEQPVPVLLVGREALNEAMEGEKIGHHRRPETRGLCLSEVQTVSTISRRPRIGSYDQITDLFTEPYTLVRECEVTAILVLYGLPRLLTGSILAHEMMHAWLRLRGYQTLSPNVEEGICQVLAYMWLDSEIPAGSGASLPSASSSSSSSLTKKGKQSEFKEKLGNFFIQQIESDPSAAYGDGFREGNEAVIKYGLKRTLDHILLTGCFP